MTTQPTIRLSDEQIDEYRSNGFISVDSFIDAGEVAHLRELYNRLFHSTAVDAEDSIDLVDDGSDDPDRSTIPQIMYPARYLPELLETQAVANASAVFRQLLGQDAVMNFDHAISKPPHHSAETPWHQDEAYWEPSVEHRSLSIWIALQPVTVGNGCMQFIPGSHGRGVLEHRHLGGNPAVHGLEVLPGVVDVSQAVACPLPAGGATLHDGQTLHYTGANTTDSERRAYIIGGAAPVTPRTVPRVFGWRSAAAGRP